MQGRQRRRRLDDHLHGAVLLMTAAGPRAVIRRLVRTKNLLSMLTQVSRSPGGGDHLGELRLLPMAFTDGGAWNSFVGGFSMAFLAASIPRRWWAILRNGIYPARLRLHRPSR
jgi:Amt family ammonium transporter